MGEIDVRDLGVAYGRLHVLRNLNLTVSDGEFVVLLGPSGCGKSTLLNAIAGLQEVDSGQVHIGKKNVPGKNRAHAASRWCFKPTPSIRACRFTRTWHLRCRSHGCRAPRSTNACVAPPRS